MKRPLILAVWGTVMGCGGGSEPPSGPPLTQPPQNPATLTFVVSGLVRDETGAPLQGATAEIAAPTGRAIAITNTSGSFSFGNVRGFASLHVWKDHHEVYENSFGVASDTGIAVTLRRADFTDSLILGLPFRSFVSAYAPACDPAWDAKAPCRRFSFTAKASGLLDIDITWNGGPMLDATFTTTAGTYVGTSSDIGAGRIAVTVPVAARSTYELRVNSYYEFQMFEVKASLRPAP